MVRRGERGLSGAGQASRSKLCRDLEAFTSQDDCLVPQLLDEQSYQDETQKDRTC